MPPAAERPTTSAALASHFAGPPERAEDGRLVLRRMQPEDARTVAVVVGESLDHLRPWMPWATKEAADQRTQLARITEAGEMWESGTDYIYAIFASDGGRADAASGHRDSGHRDSGHRDSGHRDSGHRDSGHRDSGHRDSGHRDSGDGALVGTIGLHRRTSDDVIEIGYWIAAAQTRRGYGAAAAQVATTLAAALPAVRRVEIQCDQANVASAAIPRKLGYRLDRIEAHEPEAPGERGRRMIWVWDTSDGVPDGAR